MTCPAHAKCKIHTPCEAGSFILPRCQQSGKALEVGKSGTNQDGALGWFGRKSVGSK